MSEMLYVEESVKQKKFIRMSGAEQ